MDEFQEIAHTGGKIDFLYSKEEQAVSIRISHAHPWATTMVQLCISYDGKVLDFVPCGGIGAVIPYPQPSLLAFLLSDREGLFGQSCPKCKSYFRSDALSGHTTCPYCGEADKGIEFLTENQLKFLGHFCESFITAHNEKRSVTVDLDELLNNMEGNSPEWLYPEERQ